MLRGNPSKQLLASLIAVSSLTLPISNVFTAYLHVFCGFASNFLTCQRQDKHSVFLIGNYKIDHFIYLCGKLQCIPGI